LRVLPDYFSSLFQQDLLILACGACKAWRCFTVYFLPIERVAVKTPRLLRDSWPIWSLQSGKHEWAAWVISCYI